MSNNNELPIRAHHEPPINGPHEIVGEPGITHHLVFAGPNAQTRDNSTAGRPVTQAEVDAILTDPTPESLWHRQLRHVVGGFAGLAAILAAALLLLEWPQLTVASRLACAAVPVLVAVGFVIARARRRKVRN